MPITPEKNKVIPIVVGMNYLAIVLFGANLGDRMLNIRRALDHLSSRFGKPEKISSLYETAPWGDLSQPAYLNCVAGFRTAEGPAEVLHTLLQTEEKEGRIRQGHQFESRTIDLDLLLYGDAILHRPGLQLPHPRMNQRKFTLVPLCEIYPQLVHPVEKLTFAELLLRCEDTGLVTYYQKLK